MKTPFSRKQVSHSLAFTLALAFVAGAAQAQMGSTTPDESRQLWNEATKTQIWRNPQGLCWQSPYGPPPGYTECNPAPVAQYVAPAAPAPAPVYVAPPAPAPAPVIAPAPLEPRKPRG